MLRLAALLHDIGKPKTRSCCPDGRVAFHHHEAVGAGDGPGAAQRSCASRRRWWRTWPNLIGLHLRFHGYGTGEWTDSAVRRYVSDAGPLLTRLHALTRADCTTTEQAKAARLARAYDDLEERIAVLAEQEELAKIRPDLDGNEIMEILGVRPGPLVGRRCSTCWTCAWSTGRWAPSGPLRSCGAGRRRRAWTRRDDGGSARRSR